MLSRIAVIVAVLPGLLAAQAAGKAIGATFDKMGQILQGATDIKPAQRQTRAAPGTRAKSTVAGRRSAPAVPKVVPSVSYEDPAGIQEGMEYDEVMRRFGSPAMKFTSGPGDELLSYANKDQSFDVQMRNGKVTTIQKTGGSDPSPAAKLP